jgi:hypothetical protein
MWSVLYFITYLPNLRSLQNFITIINGHKISVLLLHGVDTERTHCSQLITNTKQLFYNKVIVYIFTI